MSLNDKKIIGTRAPYQMAKIVKILQDKGAILLIYPCIDISPPHDNRELDDALRNLKIYTWLILTNSNAVSSISRRIDVLQIQVNWLQIKIAVVGASTASAVETLLCRTPDFIPTEQMA